MPVEVEVVRVGTVAFSGSSVDERLGAEPCTVWELGRGETGRLGVVEDEDPDGGVLGVFSDIFDLKFESR